MKKKDVLIVINTLGWFSFNLLWRLVLMEFWQHAHIQQSDMALLKLM